MAEERPGRSGTNRAARRAWRPKARRGLRSAWKRPARRVTLCISPASRLCARPSTRSGAASTSTLSRCCRICCLIRATQSGRASGLQVHSVAPLRHERNHAALWKALGEGLIDTVARITALHDGAKDGRPRRLHADSERSAGDRRPRQSDLHVWSEAWALDLCRFVDALSTRAAKIFGSIAQGNACGWLRRRHRDLRSGVPRTISAARQYTGNDYNCYEGWAIEGRPSIVTVRGKVQVRDGEFVGEQGRGRMIRRTPRMA